MRRRLWHVAVVLSLVLVAATVLLWVRSYRHFDSLSVTRGANRWSVTSPPRRLELSQIHHVDGWPAAEQGWQVKCQTYGPIPGDRHRASYAPPQPEPGLLGFAVSTKSYAPHRSGFPGALEAQSLGRPLAMRVRKVTVPDWAVCTSLAVLPAAALLRRWRRARRAGQGRCPACGYDLRATPDRCPECGLAARPPHNPPMQRTATASSGAVE